MKRAVVTLQDHIAPHCCSQCGAFDLGTQWKHIHRQWNIYLDTSSQTSSLRSYIPIMLDLEAIRALAEPNAELTAFLASPDRPTPPNLPDIASRRAFTKQRSRNSIAKPHAGVKETPLTIPLTYAGSGVNSSSILVAPTDLSTTKVHPLVCLFYGGGFVQGEPEQLVPLARGLASLFGCISVCAEYRLAPEHPFPAQAQDGWDILQWAAKNAATLGATPEHGFIVGGVSAGGNISAVIAQKAKDEGLTPKLTGQYLSIPALFGPGTVPKGYEEYWISHVQNADGPGLNKAAIDMTNATWKPDWTSTWASPANAPSGAKGLPKAYLQVDGADPLRDDGLIYEDILKTAGVETKLDIYPGLPHGHFAFFPSLKVSQEAVVDMGKGFGWLLGMKVDENEARKAMERPAGA